MDAWMNEWVHGRMGGWMNGNAVIKGKFYESDIWVSGCVSGGKEKCAHALEKYKCARVNMHFIYIERKQKMVMHLAHVTGV